MIAALDVFREITFWGVSVRLLFAMFCGGLIGIQRERLRRAKGLAGFRTFMLVCVGAALTMILSQYEYTMATGSWSAVAEKVGITTDVSRLGAQVINGIGFLGAGTIIVTRDDKIQGLTTAAGLWASACLGLAIGAGFFECAVVAVVLIFVSMYFFANLSDRFANMSNQITLRVVVPRMEDLAAVIHCLHDHQIAIMEVNLGDREISFQGAHKTEAVFELRLPSSTTTEMAIVWLSQLGAVKHVHEM